MIVAIQFVQVDLWRPELRAAKWSTITIERQPHACIEIKNHQPFFQGQHSKRHVLRALMPNDENDVAQLGGHTPANSKS